MFTPHYIVVVVVVLWRSVSSAIDDGGLPIEFDFPFNSHAINTLEKHRKFSSFIVFKNTDESNKQQQQQQQYHQRKQ